MKYSQNGSIGPTILGAVFAVVVFMFFITANSKATKEEISYVLEQSKRDGKLKLAVDVFFKNNPDPTYWELADLIKKAEAIDRKLLIKQELGDETN